MKNTLNAKSLVLTVLVAALIYSPHIMATQDTITLGGIAGNVHGGASILARFLWAACILVGIALFFTAFTQFQIHRKNAKLVPLTTPAMYLILALVALGIPFAEKIFGFKDGDDENDKTISTKYVDIDKN